MTEEIFRISGPHEVFERVIVPNFRGLPQHITSIKLEISFEHEFATMKIEYIPSFHDISDGELVKKTESFKIVPIPEESSDDSVVPDSGSGS